MVRKENKSKTVWVLTYNDWTNGNKREIFGVYADEDSANDALNDDLLLPFNDTVTEGDVLWAVLDPEITQHHIIETIGE